MTVDLSQLTDQQLRDALAAREQAAPTDAAAATAGAGTAQAAPAPLPTIPGGGFQVPQAPPVQPAHAAPTGLPAVDNTGAIATLQAQLELLQAQLAAVAAGGIAVPEPRFHTIFDLFRELAARTLGSDTLHEFIATVNALEEADQPALEQQQVQAAQQPAPAATFTPPPGA